MNALRGELDHTASFDGLPSLIENHHVAGPCFRPMQAEWQNKKLISLPWNAYREMIVNAFFKAIQNGQAQCCG